MDYTTRSCREFVSVLASPEPAPGGGGAAALVGAIGTALGNMVGSLTVGKKKYADVEEDIISLKAQADKLQEELLALVEDRLTGLLSRMGLPSTAAYIIAASIGAPALIQAGIPLIAAHLFVFYFAIMSFITPPVAMSAYAASGIAKSSAGKTGLLAFMLGLAGFVIPFFYAYRPALLLVGAPAGEAIWCVIVATIATVNMSVAVIGYLKKNLNPVFRIALGAAALLLVLPLTWGDIAGLAISAAVYAYCFFGNKKLA